MRRTAATDLEDRTKSRNLGHLKEVWNFVKPYKGTVLMALVSLVVAAGAVLAIGAAVRRIIDEGFGQESVAFMDTYFLGLLGIVVLLALSTFGRFYCVTWLGERVVADLRRKVYDHVVGLSPEFYETTRVGEVLSRLTTDTTLIQSVIGSSASVAMRNILLFIGGTVMLVITSPKMAGLVFLIVPAVVIPIVVFGRKVRVLSRQAQDRVADVSAHAGETLHAVQTVQAFCQEDRERDRFSDKAEAALDAAVGRIKARAWLTAIVILLVFGAVDAVLWIGGKDVAAGAMSPGELAAFIFYSIVTASSFGALSEVMGELQKASGAAERLVDLLQTKPIIETTAQPKPMPKPPVGSVHFDNVTFHYPSRPETSALEAFNLDVKPGEKVALVGPSGSGKSTVFQLLMRYYDPQQGCVSVDGVALKEALPRELRSRIGVVPQDAVIFAASAMENIRYGRPDASDDEVKAAAAAAAATEFIERLPEGYDTFLGERGVRLSGGERQRIAIARAILRNPPILLLDEATSALDAQSERMVQEALDGLMVGRTTLMIAHRLATVLKADRIVVLDQGEVVASGSHHELMAQDGLYANLAKLQFNADELVQS